MTVSTTTRGADAFGDVRARPRRPTDSFILAKAYVVVVVAAVVDVPNFLDRGNFVRYLLLLVPIGALVWARLRLPSTLIRKPTGSDIVLLVLWVFGICGAVVGAVVLHAHATTLPVFLPMAIAFLYLGTLDPLSDDEVLKLLRALAIIGSVYICLNALVNAHLVPGVDAKQYRNASLLFMALGLGGTIVLRWWRWLAVLVLLEMYVFATYPSGTTVLVVCAIVLTFAMTAPRPAARYRPYAIAGACGIAVAVLLVNFSAGVSVTSDYFRVVGKNNADSVRVQAWSEGIDDFIHSPLVGNGFTDALGAIVVHPGGRGEFQIPFHNDYVLFLAKGGLLGFGLLLTWMVSTELIAVRRYATLVEDGQYQRAGLVRALLVGYNVFFVTSAFNPTILGMSRGASLFAVYALIMMVSSSARIDRAWV
jgi:O-Antigen ligase